jgi:hypothetical protein
MAVVVVAAIVMAVYLIDYLVLMVAHMAVIKLLEILLPQTLEVVVVAVVVIQHFTLEALEVLGYV